MRLSVVVPVYNERAYVGETIRAVRDAAAGTGFELELLDWFRGRHAGLLGAIRDSGKLPDGEAVETAVADFKTQFAATLADATANEGTADPTATDAEAPGEPHSHKTLETE